MKRALKDRSIVVDLGSAVSRKYGRRIHSYTATANQTTFAGLSYTNGASQVSVYLNGAKLSAATYTATSGNTVVLGTGASVDDEVEILVLDSGAGLGGSLGGDLPLGTPDLVPTNPQASAPAAPAAPVQF